jgi:hypothetical protein
MHNYTRFPDTSSIYNGISNVYVRFVRGRPCKIEEIDNSGFGLDVVALGGGNCSGVSTEGS